MTHMAIGALPSIFASFGRHGIVIRPRRVREASGLLDVGERGWGTWHAPNPVRIQEQSLGSEVEDMEEVIRRAE